MTLESHGQRPRFLWGLFCDHFLIDASGKHSFIGVFDRIGAPQLPAVHKVMYMVFSLRGEPGAAAKGVVTVWTPDATILLSTNEAPVTYSAQGRALLVHLLYDVNFALAGEYSVVLEIDGRPAGRLELEVYTALPGAGAAPA